MDFETALRKQLEKRPDRNRIARRRILAVLDAKPSKARTRRLARMERAAAGVVGADAGAIDWSAVDWLKLFETILAVVLKILDLLA